MATKIEWTATDLAATKVLANIFACSGLSYRGVESRASIGMSFTRVRDIVQGRRAPVRLSEFLAICEVCNADPVQTLRRIIDEADRLQAEQDAKEREEKERERRRRELEETAARESRLEEETLRALNEDPYSLAAYHDPHKQDPDPDNIA